MHLKYFVCYLLLLAPVYPIQTPSETCLHKNQVFFISRFAKEFECLDAIIGETFRYADRSLITLTEAEEETEDLQDMVIKRLNLEGKATLGLLGEPPHHEFESSTICFGGSNGSEVETCRKNFVLKKSTDFYVIISGSFETLQRNLFSAYNSSTFNPSAEFLLLWRHSGDVAVSDLVPVLWHYQMLKVVLVEHDVRSGSMTVHAFKLKLSGPGLCMEKSRFFPAGPCDNPGHRTRLQALIRSRTPKTFRNCTIEAISMQYEPFVINEREGIEIRLLEEMAKHNNVTFTINVTEEAKDWGDKVNGSWEGNLAEIINTLKVGIGNVGPEADRLEDFDFTYSYKSTILVWVVPVAENVAKWRVLTMIFTLDLWSVILAVLILLSGLFVVFSRSYRDNTYLQSVSGGFLTSLQILISSSVHNTPTTNVLRLVFLGGLLFALIVTCVYSSYLVNVLTKVVKEHQIQNEKEIIESNLLIGGLKEYLERFEKSNNDDCLDEICKRFRYFDDENDTAMFWIRKVEERKACTPLTRLFVQYYMLKRFEESEDGITKKIKLFIIDKPINFHSLAIVMNKGNPFKRSFDKFIKKFVEAGLMYTLTEEFEVKIRRLKYLIRNSDQGPEKLGVYHVQGPFAILGIGDIIAISIFLVEKLWYNLKSRKKAPDTTRNRRDPKDKNLYYDEKYGNLYGKNYPKEQE